MEGFKSYLLSGHVPDEKKAGFYLYWVSQFYGHCNKSPGDRVGSKDIDRYLKSLSRRREDWQIQQASEAIELYLFFRRKKQDTRNSKRPDANEQWKSVVDDMKKMLRLKHFSLRNEKTYLGWMRRFYRFLNGQPPNRLDSTHVKDFMTHLAVDRSVAASIQNQAFNAILFLFRHVLDKSIDDISEVIRAKRKRRLPVVLTKPEITRLFEQMSGTKLLMAKTIYGCGLRLRECMNLRIKDIDFSRMAVTVHGKGDKDRETVLPISIKDNLKGFFNRIPVVVIFLQK
jgi:integrase